MKKDEVLQKFKEKPVHEKLLQLKRGGSVIGEEVDEENRLWYVIEKEGQITLERANGKLVENIVPHRAGGTIFVPIKRIFEEKEKKPTP